MIAECSQLHSIEHEISVQDCILVFHFFYLKSVKEQKMKNRTFQNFIFRKQNELYDQRVGSQGHA